MYKVKSDEKTSVDKWFEISTTPQKYETIKKMAMLDAYDGDNRICYSYICQYQQFTEKQLDELITITSPLYKMMSQLTPENISIATAIIATGDITKQKELVRAMTNSKLVSDKRFASMLNQWLLKVDKEDTTMDELDNSKIKPTLLRDRLDWYNIINYQKHLSAKFREKYKNFIRDYCREHSAYTGVPSI